MLVLLTVAMERQEHTREFQDVLRLHKPGTMLSINRVFLIPSTADVWFAMEDERLPRRRRMDSVDLDDEEFVESRS